MIPASASPASHKPHHDARTRRARGFRGMTTANSNALVKRMTAATAADVAKVRAGQHEAGTRFPIQRIDAGKLVLPTGRICVTDAYSADQFPPLNRIVARGDYPVEIV